MRKRSYRLRKRKHLYLNKIVRTKKDLLVVRNVFMSVFKQMGISRRIRHFPVRFGKDKEFVSETNTGLYSPDGIVVRRYTTVSEVFRNLGHEYGHEIPITGAWGRKSNSLTETTANSFHRMMLKKFNQIYGTNFELKPARSFFKGLITCFPHTIGAYFMFIPSGKYFKSKYKV